MYETYWYRKEEGSVREVFENSGYLIVSLNLKKHMIILEQNAESYLFLPTNAQCELEGYYQYILKKYGLVRRKKRGGDVYLNVR